MAMGKRGIGAQRTGSKEMVLLGLPNVHEDGWGGMGMDGDGWDG
jgi:hypothetical protein